MNNRRLRRTQALLAVVLLCVATGAWKCGSSAERNLVKAEDDAAVVISKLEKVRTDLLTAGKIDAPTATKIDQALLRMNTAVKHVSAEGDRYAANPTDATPVRSAIGEVRAILDETIRAVNDGTLGVVNLDSRKTIVALINSLKAITGVVENSVISIENRRK